MDAEQILIDIHTIRDGEIKDFSWKKIDIEDHRPVLEQNYVDKCNENNGFTQKRMFRRLARIPVAVIEVAKQMGYDMERDGDLFRFLRDNPEFLTVKSRLTARNGDGRIIIK